LRCITPSGNTVQQHHCGKQAIVTVTIVTGDRQRTVYSAKQLRNPAKFTAKLQIIYLK